MNSRRRNNLPYGVLALAAVNVLYFIYLLLAGALGNTLEMAEKGALVIIEGRYSGGMLPLFASMFMHFDIHHLGGNMLMLLVVGDLLEKQIGTVWTVAVYLLTGLAGNGVSILWYGLLRDTVVSAGASGAIYGLIGALFCLMLRSKGRFSGLRKERMLIMIVLMIYSGVTSVGINLAAHVGGLLAGILAGLFLSFRKGRAL